MRRKWIFLLAMALAVAFGVFNGYASIKLHLPTIVTSLFLMFIGTGIQTLYFVVFFTACGQPDHRIF